MEKADVIIIGAGVSGLLAASDLSSAGLKVIVIEACDRIGGRVYGLYNKGYERPPQLGAEFIHGDLPLTKPILKEANISFRVVKQDFHQSGANEQHSDTQSTDWEDLLNQLEQLRDDISLSKLLQQKFPGKKYAALRSRAKNYAAGYNAADPTNVSAMSLWQEWSND